MTSAIQTLDFRFQTPAFSIRAKYKNCKYSFLLFLADPSTIFDLLPRITHIPVPAEVHPFGRRLKP